MDSTPDVMVVIGRRNHLRQTIDKLCEELENNMNKPDATEEEVANTFLKLEEKIQRLNAFDDKLLLLTHERNLTIDVEKEQDDNDAYNEKVWFCRKKYEAFKEKKNSPKAESAAKVEEKIQQPPIKSILEKSTSKNPEIDGTKSKNVDINKLQGKKNWSDDPTKLEYLAFGTNPFIGQLYDARRNTFYSNSLFSEDMPADYIQTIEDDKVKIKISDNDQLSDRFKLLGVNPDQQLFILSDLLNLSGHGSYLLEGKTFKNIISSTLLYNHSAKEEKLVASFDQLEPYFEKDNFLNISSTHVIVGIIWGVNCTLTLNYQYSEESEKPEAENLLKSEINNLRAFIESSNENFTTSTRKQNDFYKNLILKIRSDVPDPKLKPLLEFQKGIKFIPLITKFIQNGKAVPFMCIMVNVLVFKDFIKPDKISRMTQVTPIGESCITLITRFFEELEATKEELNSIIKCLYKYEKYFSDEILAEAESLQGEIEEIETYLREFLSEQTPHVKSGQREIGDLMKMVESLRGFGSKFARIIDRISSLNLSDSILFIDECLSNNIIVLGKKEKLSDVMSSNPNYDSYVFYVSPKSSQGNKTILEKTFNLLMWMANHQKINCQYIVVDLEYATLETYEGDATLVLYRNEQVVLQDVLAHYLNKKNKKPTEKSGNFARLLQSEKFSKANKPLKRTALKLICPGSVNGNCPNVPLTWICKNCETDLEFGFDSHFYCNCGKGPSISYEFKCSSVNHDNKFIRVIPPFPLREELNKLSPPLKEMNILILGQTGVGKSTWINSITNYFKYETFEEAKKEGVECVIPASFTINRMTKERLVKQLIKIGSTDDKNETTSGEGKSATQNPRTYKMPYRGREICLIDTPGIGDTRGIEQDKKNMKKIIDHISFLDKLHGICILLQANVKRIDPVFRFCITELLIHLHKNAARNIIFCFTHARSTMFNLGDTTSLLDNFLAELDIQNMIALRNDTAFSLDNEAFRYLCTLRCENMHWKESDEKIYKSSWDKSVAETRRLFECIEKLKPHPVEATTTLCNARNRIGNLMKPMADITQTIQMNLAIIREEEKRIKNTNASVEELARKLHIPQIVLVSTPLPFPMTVCTSSKCVSYHRLEHLNVTTVNYEQVCHDHCSLENIEVDTYPNEALRKCFIFSFDPNKEKCAIGKCGCNWDSHMHITYTQKREEKQVVNAVVEDEINYKMNDAAEIEEHKQKLESMIAEYKQEQAMIMKTCLKFGAFLRENAITPYNDAFKDYLKLLIQQEIDKANKTEADDLIIKNLNGMMTRYEEEAKIFDKSRDNFKNVTPQDIANLEQDLYGLKLTGDQIKSSMKVSMASNKDAKKYAEKELPVKNIY